MAVRDQPGSKHLPAPRIRGSLDNFLENLIPVVDGIASILGENCEVVLHDLRHPERSIVRIANGHITGRKVGHPLIAGPSGDAGMKLLLQHEETESVVSNYTTRTRDGRILKSASIVFRNAKGAPVAGLCLNLDLTEFDRARKLLNGICTVERKVDQEKAGIEEYDAGPGDVAAIIRSIVDEAIAGLHTPISAADKEEKLKAVRIMYQRGLFLVKGAADHAARALGVSRFTIYNYLKELQYRDDESLT